MTTPVSNINRANLNALDPNLATGQIADPALRKACFDEIYNYFDTFVTSYNAFIASGGIVTANIADLAVTTAKLALGAVTSANILDGSIVDADVNAAAAIAWTKVSKTLSSLADLAVRSASDLTSGTLNAARLPAGISATNIGNGDVTNVILSFLNTLTSNAQTQLDAKVPLTQKGTANGVATLDSGVKIPIAQLPDAILGALIYQGTYNATTNTPALPSAVGSKGLFYIVSAAGTVSGTIYDIGDWIVSNGTVWQKVDNTDAVSSFNSRLGAIVPTAGDYDWSQITKTISSLADLTTRSASDLSSGTLPDARRGARTGDVTSPSGSGVNTIAALAVTNAKIATGVDATKIANGSVSNTEFQYLDGVTSAIQPQITARANDIGVLSGLTTTDKSSLVNSVNEVRATALALSSEYNLKLQGGCVGDGVTDDTANFRTALAYAQANGLSLFIPKGTYLVDKIDYGTQTNAHQISIIGEDRSRTIIKKKTSDGQDLFVIGNASGTNYIANLTVKDITFQGITGNTPSALKLYDVVRSELLNIRCTNAIIGLDFQGCIAIMLSNSLCDFNQFGWNLTKFTSAAGGGYPNIISAYSSQFTDNTKWGVWFDYGRIFNLNDCEIEGNGTLSDATTGGLYVGPNIGSEGGGTFSVGINLEGTWFEGNSGDASIQLNSGRNTIEECYFIANPNATNDIHVKGGKYHINFSYCANSKTANVLEDVTALVFGGNTVENNTIPNITYDALKTNITYNTASGLRMLMRNGELPIVNGLSSPMMQQGNDSTASGVVNITFPVAFASTSGLVINVTMNNNSSGTLDVPEVYNVTTTGFTVRKKSITSGSATVGTTNAGFYWTAIGTK